MATSTTATTPIPASRSVLTTGVASAPLPRVTDWPFRLRDFLRSHVMATYFVFAFAGTWLAVSPLVLGPSGLGLLPVALPDALSLLIYFGATYAGPTVAAFAASWIEGGGAGVRRFAASYGRWRVAPRWWLIAPIIFPTLWLLGYSAVMGGAPLFNLAQSPLMLATVFLPALVLHAVVALGEEAGWRGFALPRLQPVLGPVRATIVLGLLHGLWHLPVFLVAGLLGPFTVSGFATFLVVAVFGTFIYTWVSNHANHSILIATLVHAGSNAATNLLTALIEDPHAGDPWIAWLLTDNRLNVLIFGAATLVLLTATRGRLGYRPDSATATARATGERDAHP